MTEIPIESGVPSQTFKVDLDENTYNFRVIYNTRLGTWTFDLSDEDGVALCSGVTMVLSADLINQFNLGIGSLFMLEEGSTRVDASVDDLGDRIILAYLTPQEVLDGVTV
jgi:hypothetical protein